MSKDAALKSLFKGIGLPESLAAEIEKDDFKPETAIADFHSAQKEHYSGIIRNEVEDEIKEGIIKSTEGRVFNTLNNDLKKHFGVDAAKIKDLPVHEKLKVVKEFIDEQYKKNPGTEEIQKLQSEKMEWQNKFTDLENSMASKIEEAQNKANETIITKLGDIDLQKAYSGIASEKIVGGKHTDGHVLALRSVFGSKYKFGQDEKGNTIPLEKETGKRVTAKDASQKEYFVTLPEIVLSSMKDLSFLKESNGGEGSGQNGSGSGVDGQKQKSARVIEMEKKIAEHRAS